MTEAELKQLLAGKALYLRDGYLDNDLSFNEHGKLISHSPQGSYTLCAIQINKVHLSKHKVELEGIRYGLHFVGQLPYEDPSTAADRVRITPPKKEVRITIDREIVVKPKRDRSQEKKEKQAKKEKKEKDRKEKAAAPTSPALAPAAKPAAATAAPAAPPSASTNQAAQGQGAQAGTGQSQPAPESGLSDADQLKASIDAAPEAERPADPKSVTTTYSPAHAAEVLRQALDNIFAAGLDARMIATLPECWKLYYQAVEARKDWYPIAPSILRQDTVDRKARLLASVEPDSNEYAQANGIAGMALYHAVIGADGKAGQIAVGRPIGFGLDENAVAAIRKARFEPAMKDGKPVPVLVDLVLEFRIFDKRTSAPATPPPPGAKPAPVLPGPYSLPPH